jgi:hypothetical protein
MYTRCLSCRAFLGRNESLETLPVGRHFAHDPERGRLWVLCRGCRSWNLAPLLERWEALEELERLFEGAAEQASTEEMARRRSAEGLTLLRVGRPGRREFAAWRYAPRLRSRSRRFQLLTYAASLGPPALAMGTSLSLLWAGPAALALWGGVVAWRDRYPLTRTDEGEVVQVGDASKMRLLPAPRGDAPDPRTAGWALELPRRGGPLRVEGTEALRILRSTLPRANCEVGAGSQVRTAVDLLGSDRSRPDLLAHLAQEMGREKNRDPMHNPINVFHRGDHQPHRVATVRAPLRLALEMAVNEEVEWRALDGEMAELQREWKEAEALAAISDNLLLPEKFDAWIRRERSRAKQPPPV